MARIRSIKPEFPQSESMGRVSRDARLLFVELWTIADDEGRLRGNSRMLASLLFPYDTDAGDLIDGWLAELDREGCIVSYRIGKDSYIQILNWLQHQKIDHPSKSKIPAPPEASRDIESPREASCQDQGSRIKDQGGEGKSAPPAPPAPDGPESDWPVLNCARWLLETCGIPVTFPNQQAVSAGIGALSRQRGSPTHSAAAQLCALARDALREGIPVDRFWFEDAKWRRGETAKPAHPKIKPFDTIGQLASQIEQLHGFDCGYDPVAMVEKAKAGGVFDGRSAKPEEVTERLRQVNATREKIERSKGNGGRV